MLLRSNKQGEKVGEESKRGRKKQVKEPHQQREQSEGKTPQNGAFHGKKVSKNETFCEVQILNLLTKGLSDFLVTKKKKPFARGSDCLTIFVVPSGCDTSTFTEYPK